MHFPEGSAPHAGWPIVFAFHGWANSAEEYAKQDGPLRSFAANAAIVIHPEGWPSGVVDDPPSWNGGGSAGANAGGGEDGPICVPSKVQGSHSGFCYASCERRGYCKKADGGATCRWSHCEDDVAFVLAALEDVRARAKVDNSRVYATGDSNGAIFLYELASDPRSSSTFSAIAPMSGLPHNGFNRGSINRKMRLLNLVGNFDTYVYSFPNVPSDSTKSYGADFGWFFSSVDNTTGLWASDKGLRPTGDVALQARHGQHLKCHGWSPDGSVELASLAVCAFDGGHCTPPYNREARQVIWNFFGLATGDDSMKP